MPEYLKCPQCHEDLSFERTAIAHGRLKIELDGLITEDWQSTDATGPIEIFCCIKECDFKVP